MTGRGKEKGALLDLLRRVLLAKELIEDCPQEEGRGRGDH